MARQVLAAIDLGSQAVRLKVARRARGGRLQQLARRRLPLRSGEAVFGEGGLISDELAGRMVTALGLCAQDCARHGALLRAVATSSLREAVNRAEVLERVRRETGIDLEVISGREEARLVCLGALEGNADERTSLCVDLGGGSVEVALAHGENPVSLHSVAAGALRLAKLVGWAPARELRLHAAAAVEALPARLAHHTDGLALGSSGTIRALVAFVTGGERRRVSAVEIHRAVDELAGMNAVERGRWFSPERAQVMAAGAAVLEATLSRLGVRRLEASKRGLRDGVLVDLSRGEWPSRRIYREVAFS